MMYGACLSFMICSSLSFFPFWTLCLYRDGPNETCSHKMRDKSQNFISKLIPRLIFCRLQALKWFIKIQGYYLFLSPRPIISLRNSFVFYWLLTYFSEPYLLSFSSDLSSILWEYVSNIRTWLYSQFAQNNNNQNLDVSLLSCKFWYCLSS